MKLTRIFTGVVFLIIVMLFQEGCKTENFDNIPALGRQPVLDPDYSGVTIPPNIAPMNFNIMESGAPYIINITSADGMRESIKSKDGIVVFPLKSWKNLIKKSKGGKIGIEIISVGKDKNAKKFDPLYMNVAEESADPYICYRLLYPGYKYWVDMKIVQRSVEDFKEKSIFENQLLEDNCVNCHSFKQNDPNRFLLHVRGSMGGTYFVDGKKITRASLKTKNMLANAVYPSWHPSGKYVAFSSNKTVQTFHMRPEQNIEVFDQFSSLLIYDVEKNEMFTASDTGSVKYMETFPCWSPDGGYLYYCRALQIKDTTDYRNVKYDLVRKSFNPVSGQLGKAEVVFDAFAINKSVSFPSVSPDGKYLVFTLHDYGTFSIWHKEADLYLLHLENGKVGKMSLNSSETESWHSWSSNSKWLVFSSKRGDGLTARPYFAYLGSPDDPGKPFVLPQKDPSLYKRMERTFNRPEFVTGKINIGPRDFEKSSENEATKANWKDK